MSKPEGGNRLVSPKVSKRLKVEGGFYWEKIRNAFGKTLIVKVIQELTVESFLFAVISLPLWSYPTVGERHGR